jgi:hypothetical protein
MADLALGDEFGKGADGVLDRGVLRSTRCW